MYQVEKTFKRSIGLAIALLVTFVAVLRYTSINNPWPVMFASLAVAFVCLLKWGLGIYEALNALMILMLVFDSDLYAATSFKIRIWYVLILFFYFAETIRALLINKKVGKSNLVALLFFITLSVFVSFGDSSLGNLYCIKYWLFTAGLVFWFATVLRRVALGNFSALMPFIMAVFLAIALFGLWQFAANKLGFGALFMRIPGNIRPDAFFSETTWYATFCFAGILFAAYLLYTHKDNRFYIVGIVFLAGMFVSNTRNAFLGLLSIIFLEVILFIKKRRKVRARTLNLALIASVVAGLLIIRFSNVLASYVDVILIKLSLRDDSAQGRLIAFKKIFDGILNSPIIGHGFDWDSTTDIIHFSGTALGAKAFNIFLQVGYIFGFVGLLPFIAIIIYVLYRKWYLTVKVDPQYKFSFMYIFCFFLLSSFAPVHQFPSGVMILGLASIVTIGAKNEIGV